MGTMGTKDGVAPGAAAKQHLEQVKARLAITPAQEGAWQVYVDRVDEQAALMQALHAQRHAAPDADIPAPDRMARHLELMSQRLAGMQGVSSALQELYAVLSPEQRALADRQIGPMGGAGHRGHMGRAGQMGHMGPTNPMSPMDQGRHGHGGRS